MVQLILSSSSLFQNSTNVITPTIIKNNGSGALSVPYNYYDQIYGKAKFDLNSLVFSDDKQTRRMYLKSFRGTYLQMTTEKNYNNHLWVNNVTDGTVTNYVFEPKLFKDVPDFVTYLNSVCVDLVISWNDPSITPQNYNQAVDKCVITAKVGGALDGKIWNIDFDEKSINRSLGFDLGVTPNINPGESLVSNTPFTVESIGRIYLSLQVGTKAYSNGRSPVSFIVYVQGTNLDNTPAKSLSFNSNTDFEQHIEITSSQFNQLVVSILDEYGNIVYLGGHYSMVYEIE